MKLWAGRFQKETDALVNDFNSSISFDARLYRQDIAGSIAHATMLGEQGIIAKEEADKTVTIRRLGSEKQEIMPLAEAVAALAKEAEMPHKSEA